MGCIFFCFCFFLYQCKDNPTCCKCMCCSCFCIHESCEYFKIKKNNRIKKVKPVLQILQPSLNKVSKCPICLESIKKNGVTLLCNDSHAFHKKCILKWLKHNNTCPLCRKKIFTPNPIYNDNLQPYAYNFDSDSSYDDDY